MLAVQQPVSISVDLPGLSDTCLHPGRPTLVLAADTDVPQEPAHITLMNGQLKAVVDGPRDQQVAATASPSKDGSTAGGSGKGLSRVPSSSKLGSKAGSTTALEGLTIDPKPQPKADHKHQAGYSSDAYWNDRYAERNTHFDWFFTYSALQQLICATCWNRNLPMLHVGCGNSGLSEGMARDGFEVSGRVKRVEEGGGISEADADT